MELTPFEIKDFSGGFTDNYINRDPKKCKSNINFLVTTDSKLEVRPGSVPYDVSNAQLPSGNQRVGSLMNYGPDVSLFAQSAKKFYYYTSSWQHLVGPTSNEGFSAGSASDITSHQYWKGHLLATNDAGAKPIKIYKDGSSVFQLRTAGLPDLASTQNYVDATLLASAITLANAIRTKMIAHATDAQTIYITGTCTSGNDTITGIADTSEVTVGNFIDVESGGGFFTFASTVLAKTSSTIQVSSNFTGTTGSKSISVINQNTGVALHQKRDSAMISLPSAATDLPTLLTLSNAMKDAFTNHIEDVINVAPITNFSTTPIRVYHRLFTFTQTLASGAQRVPQAFDDGTTSNCGPNPILPGSDIQYNSVFASITPPTNYTTLADVANFLNDLKFAYNAHDLGYFLHGDYAAQTINSTRGRQLVTSAYLTAPSSGPTMSGNYQEIYDLANGLKEIINGHFLDHAHSNEDTVHTITSSNATDFESLYTLTNEIKVALSQHMDDAIYTIYSFSGNTTSGNATIASVPSTANLANNMWLHQPIYAGYFPALSFISSFIANTSVTINATSTFSASSAGFGASLGIYHTGTLANPFPISSAFNVERFPDYETVLAELALVKSTYNTHQSNASLHLLGGTSTYTVSRHTVPTVSTILYALHYSYTYNVGTLQFIDKGPVTIIGSTTNPQTSVYFSKANGTTIQNIPVLANGSTDNYDTSNVKVEIFRTIDDGSTLYKVGEVTNGTTTFTDTTLEDDLVNNELIYITGGVVDNDPPPIAKYIHICNNFCYYGNITESSELLGSQIRQSISNDPDSVPADFSIDLEDDVTGISSYKGRVIAFTNRGVYRLEGQFDELGRGAITYEKIFDRDGCIAHNSIVQIPEGIVYAGNDGFYYTDAYQVLKISEEFNQTYKSISTTASQKANIQGMFDPLNQRVWWAVKSEGASTNDKAYVVDLRFGIKADSCFSTLSNTTYFAPTWFLFYQRQILRADTRGYVFKHDPSYYSDPKINTGTGADASIWDTVAIPYNFTTASTDFGTSQVRKWASKMSFIAKNDTDLSTQIASINDDGRQDTDLKTVRMRSITGLIERKLWMPANNLRCNQKQIRFDNAYVVITNSDTIAAASVDSTLKTVTLNSGSWPTNIQDFYISFNTDSYAHEYLVTLRNSSTVLTYSDAGNLSTTGSNVKWLLKGLPKNERLHLVSITMDYQVRSRSQTPFQATTTDTGANA